MPSDLYSSLGGQPQNPREQCMSILKQRGIMIPDGIAGNPQAIIQHLMNSGIVPQNRLGMAQQMISRLFRR